MYSYDWLENLADLDVHSAEEIVPELQDLEVGDLVRLAPESMGAEAGLARRRDGAGACLVLHQPADPDTGRPSTATIRNWATTTAGTGCSSWAGGGRRTRLIVRSRVDGRPAVPDQGALHAAAWSSRTS